MLCATFVAESSGVSSITFTQCALEATEFGEMTQNKDHYDVQVHSKSPILVPIGDVLPSQSLGLVLKN